METEDDRLLTVAAPWPPPSPCAAGIPPRPQSTTPAPGAALVAADARPCRRTHARRRRHHRRPPDRRTRGNGMTRSALLRRGHGRHLGAGLQRSPAGPLTRLGFMVDTQVVIRLAFLQPISAIDLNGESMITGPGHPPAGCRGCDALPQPSRGDADDRAPGAVDGTDDRVSLGRRQALRADDLAGGVPSRSGAQT
jgi:hypothetical protein